MYHVSVCSHVLIPTKGTDEWLKMAAHIKENNTLEDANIILADDSAIATWLFHAAEVGNFTQFVQPCDFEVNEVTEFYCTNGPRPTFTVSPEGNLEQTGHEDIGPTT